MKQIENMERNESKTTADTADTADTQTLTSQDQDLNFLQTACCCLESCNTDQTLETSLLNQNEKKEKRISAPYDLFLTEFEKANGAEVKLQITINFMELSLAQSGNPHFKSFWDARTLCLQLFKENISQPLRSQTWTKYTELSKEARRLKEILDEQSAFAAEQIEIAIHALETDLTQTKENLQKSSPVDFGILAESFEGKYAFYDQIQRELYILNAQAARINALRKELIRTEMRIKVKNKFFQRLSIIGDQIFPRRKELIKDMSAQFSLDIDAFIKDHFAENKIENALFFLREEIKALQGLAKLLTLNTHSFTHTRMVLSDCWDKLKVIEKNRKNKLAQQKASYKENVNSVLEKIVIFTQKFSTGEMSIDEASQVIDEITSFMRSVELGRDEVRYLREEINKARQPLLDQCKALEDEKYKLEAEKELQKKKMLEDLKLEIEALFEKGLSLDVDSIIAARESIIEKIGHAKLSKIEKNDLEKRMKPLKDMISDKKEEAMMSLSEDDKQALTQLTAVLSQRKERRLEINTQLKLLRRTSESCGFDIEQAMKNDELIRQEKERLLKIDLGIKEIEQLIIDLKKKCL